MNTQTQEQEQATMVAEPTVLKVWNQSIKVEVEVDSIAAKLKESLKADHPHANLLTNTIIGSAMTNQNIGFIYNALNGWNNDINFAVGQFVAYKGEQRMYTYTEQATTEPADKPTWKQERVSIIGGRIKQINEFAAGAKVLLEYTKRDSSGTLETSVDWVNHKDLTLIEEGNDTMLHAIQAEYLTKYN